MYTLENGARIYLHASRELREIDGDYAICNTRKNATINRNNLSVTRGGGASLREGRLKFWAAGKKWAITINYRRIVLVLFMFILERAQREKNIQRKREKEKRDKNAIYRYSGIILISQKRNRYVCLFDSVCTISENVRTLRLCVSG